MLCWDLLGCIVVCSVCLVCMGGVGNYYGFGLVGGSVG